MINDLTETDRLNIAASLKSAAEALKNVGVKECRREAASLLAFILEKDAVFLIAHPEYLLTERQAVAFDCVIRRRAGREPFQYITGRKEFYGLDFVVSPDVLIPRPETEILVEDAIEILSKLVNPSFCEIGVGSGCISVSILHNVKTARAVGVDISDTALSTAQNNAENHSVSDRIMFRKADVYEALDSIFDLIVSNPPYVPDGDLGSLQIEVGLFEPHQALFGGSDGLDVVRRIIDRAPAFLNPHGTILIEIGFGQSESVKEMFHTTVWERVEFLPDLQGIPRVAKACLRS